MDHKEYRDVITALSDCIAACEHCATACLEEDNVKMMSRCIRLDRDCADICRLTSAWLARDSEHAQHLLRECIEICEACAEECGKHEHDHCKACAEACHTCAEACRGIVNVTHA